MFATIWVLTFLLLYDCSVPYQTLSSIYVQNAHARVLRAHKHYKANIELCLSRFRAGTALVELARVGLSGSGSTSPAGGAVLPAQFSPVLLLRLVLEFGYALTKKQITQALVEPESLLAIKELQADGGSEAVQRLVAETQRCVDADQLCSPFADKMRQYVLFLYAPSLFACDAFE